MEQKKPTLKDVARLADVAPSTASAILNKREYVWSSAETKKRVMDAVETLNYKPNKWAQGVRLSEFKTVAYIIPDLLNPHYTKMARLLEESLQSFGYDLIIEESKLDLSLERKIITKLYGANIDGLFCSTFTTECDDILQKMANEGRPCFFIGGGRESIGDTLYTDYTSGLQEAMRHLAQAGHKRIGFVLGLSEGESPELRKKMFFDSLKSAGLEPRPEYILTCEPTISSAREKAMPFLMQWTEYERPTALLAINDLLAIGAMRGALDAGLQIPDQLSIIGTDNLEISRHLPISLTTISFPSEQLIQRAVTLFVDRKEAKIYDNPKRYDFSTTLVLGESTGPAPLNSEP